MLIKYRENGLMCRTHPSNHRQSHSEDIMRALHPCNLVHRLECRGGDRLIAAVCPGSRTVPIHSSLSTHILLNNLMGTGETRSLLFPETLMHFASAPFCIMCEPLCQLHYTFWTHKSFNEHSSSPFSFLSGYVVCFTALTNRREVKTIIIS